MAPAATRLWWRGWVFETRDTMPTEAIEFAKQLFAAARPDLACPDDPVNAAELARRAIRHAEIFLAEAEKHEAAKRQ